MAMQALSSATNSPKLEQNSPSQASTNLLSKAFLAKSQIKDEFKPEVQEPSEQKKQKSSPKLKTGVFATTLAGVGVAMTCILKKKGLSTNLFKAFKTSPKNWSLLNIKYEEGELAGAVTKLAIGSVGGGLIGGAIFDKKENFKAKIRESVIQMVGNIFTPLLCVTGVMNLFKKVEGKIVKAVIPTVKNVKAQKALNGIPGVIATMVALTAGIFLGNRVGNLINQKAFHSTEDRKLKLADMSPHVDDVCVAASLVDSGGIVGTYLARIVPALLMIAGVSTGTAQEGKIGQGASIAQNDKNTQAEVTSTADSAVKQA